MKSEQEMWKLKLLIEAFEIRLKCSLHGAVWFQGSGRK